VKKQHQDKLTKDLKNFYNKKDLGNKDLKAKNIFIAKQPIAGAT
jgi:hypothetical protein